jgi:hypothetical protein
VRFRAGLPVPPSETDGCVFRAVPRWTRVPCSASELCPSNEPAPSELARSGYQSKAAGNDAADLSNHWKALKRTSVSHPSIGSMLLARPDLQRRAHIYFYFVDNVHAVALTARARQHVGAAGR